MGRGLLWFCRFPSWALLCILIVDGGLGVSRKGTIEEMVSAWDMRLSYSVIMKRTRE